MISIPRFFLIILFISSNIFPEVVARIIKINGRVNLKLNGNEYFDEDVRVGLPISNGDGIKVGSNGFCAIMFVDDHYAKNWYVGTANNAASGDFYIRTKDSWNGNPTTTGIRLKYDGTLYISGGLHYSTGSVGSSDDRIKHNEKPITNAIDIINKLTAKKYFKSTEIHEANYDYTLDESGNPITTDTYMTEIGFVAQEVQKIPELNFCVEGEPTYIDNMTGEEKPQVLGLSYTNIFSLNVAATQELHKENEASVTVAADPLQLPVTFPVKGPLNAAALNAAALNVL